MMKTVLIHMRKAFGKGLFLWCMAVACVLLSSCATTPFTGRSQLMFVGKSEEKQMGEEAWKEVLSQNPKSKNQELNAAVRRVGAKIAAATGETGYAWEFVVLENSQANAFCLPGGKVAVYSGLFNYMRNDAEAAAVIGHEVAHATARHGAERISQAYVQNIGGAIAQVALAGGGVNPAPWMQAYGVATNLAGVLPFSRTQEYEADKIGLIYLSKAGYEPKAALDFWQRFAAGTQDQQTYEFLSTHPLSENRIQELDAQMDDAYDLYHSAPSKLGYGQSYSSKAPKSGAAKKNTQQNQSGTSNLNQRKQPKNR